jgi:hypothetical protein
VIRLVYQFSFTVALVLVHIAGHRVGDHPRVGNLIVYNASTGQTLKMIHRPAGDLMQLFRVDALIETGG